MHEPGQGARSAHLYRINVTERGQGSGDAWSMSARGKLGGISDTTRLDLLSRERSGRASLAGLLAARPAKPNHPGLTNM